MNRGSRRERTFQPRKRRAKVGCYHETEERNSKEAVPSAERAVSGARMTKRKKKKNHTLWEEERGEKT